MLSAILQDQLFACSIPYCVLLMSVPKIVPIRSISTSCLTAAYDAEVFHFVGDRLKTFFIIFKFFIILYYILYLQLIA